MFSYNRAADMITLCQRQNVRNENALWCSYKNNSARTIVYNNSYNYSGGKSRLRVYKNYRRRQALSRKHIPAGGFEKSVWPYVDDYDDEQVSILYYIMHVKATCIYTTQRWPKEHFCYSRSFLDAAKPNLYDMRTF